MTTQTRNPVPMIAIVLIAVATVLLWLGALALLTALSLGSASSGGSSTSTLEKPTLWSIQTSASRLGTRQMPVMLASGPWVSSVSSIMPKLPFSGRSYW